MARGTDIGKAYVQIVPSAEGIKGSIQNLMAPEAELAGASAGSSFGSKMLSVIKGVAAGGAVVKAISSMVDVGATMEQAVGGIQTIFNGAEGKMLGYAQEAYKTVGISANDYMQQATSFGAALVASLGGDTSKAADAANQALIDMADNANKMGTPIESLQNAYQGFAKQNYTMLDNLKLGYGGTKTEMERLLKDAQKITGVKYDINNLSDVYAAVHTIQEELGITGTTAEEASTTISGSMGAMKSAFTNLLGNIATGNGEWEDSLYALFDTTQTFLLDNLIPMVGDILSTMPTVIMTAIETGLPTIVENGAIIIQSVAEGITNNLPGLLEQGLNIIISIAQGIIENLPTIIEKGIEIVTNLATGIIQTLPTMFESILKAVKEIKWLDIGKAIINGIIDGVKSMISSLIDTVVSAAKQAWEAVKDVLDINSPSKKFMYIGENMALGLSEGYKNTMPSVIDDIEKQSNLLTDDISNDLKLSLNPNRSKRINNLEINFAINNEGKDITDEDVMKWSDLLVDGINERLGYLV